MDRLAIYARKHRFTGTHLLVLPPGPQVGSFSWIYLNPLTLFLMKEREKGGGAEDMHEAAREKSPASPAMVGWHFWKQSLIIKVLNVLNSVCLFKTIRTYRHKDTPPTPCNNNILFFKSKPQDQRLSRIVEFLPGMQEILTSFPPATTPGPCLQPQHLGGGAKKHPSSLSSLTI